ncbi:MAG: SRPBCC family protein [Candidatus Sumerlaeia bacterium]|nr:SRPBCC family protein [Candidatus Sumerlaeia bacterium]
MQSQQFTAELWLPQPPEEVFPFFADAFNLEEITPPWLRFRVLTPGPIPMAPGTVIDYRLRLHGVPIRWRSEITAWEPPHRFVDEQRKGPYHLWRHEHLFEPQAGGTRCVDHVDYAHRGGRLIHRFLVRPDVEAIFRFRQERLRERFAR